MSSVLIGCLLLNSMQRPDMLSLLLFLFNFVSVFLIFFVNMTVGVVAANVPNRVCMLQLTGVAAGLD